MPTQVDIKEDAEAKKATIQSIRDGFFEKLAQLQDDQRLVEDKPDNHE